MLHLMVEGVNIIQLVKLHDIKSGVQGWVITDGGYEP